MNRETPEEWANKIITADYKNFDEEFIKQFIFGDSNVNLDINTPIKIIPVSDEFLVEIKNKTDKDQHTIIEYLKPNEICHRYKDLLTQEELNKLINGE